MDDQLRGPGRAMKEGLAEKYFKPYLKLKPDPEVQTFLFDSAWTGWCLDISAEHLRGMQFVEWMCLKLAADDKGDMGNLLVAVLEEQHDAIARVDKAEAALRELEGAPEKWLPAALEVYKVYFESEYRLWATVPYCFVCKYYGLATAPEDRSAAVHIGGGEKFQALKKLKVTLPQGDIKTLIAGFDNEIRNAGAGHDRWELTDSKTIVLNVRDPKTGQLKGSERIELTIQDLRELLMQCRRTIWTLKMGVVLFSVNNPAAAGAATRTKAFKNKEIESYVEAYAASRSFKLRKFTCDPEKTKVEIELQHFHSVRGTGGALLYGSGERFDLIGIEFEEAYSAQVLSVLRYMLTQYFEKAKLPDVAVKVFDLADTCIGDVEYSGAELLKLVAPGAGAIPAARRGALSPGKYAHRGEVKVPFGKRAHFEARVRATLPSNARII